MTPDEALQFLARHQPMPADADLTQDLAEAYDQARGALEFSPDDRAARLLLNSFGEGDGFGVYPLVSDTLRTLPSERVVDALSESLRSPYRSVRAWSMDMALEYVDRTLVPLALQSLSASDRDERVFAAYFLTAFADLDPSTVLGMRDRLAQEEDEEIRETLARWLSRHESA